MKAPWMSVFPDLLAGSGGNRPSRVTREMQAGLLAPLRRERQTYGIKLGPEHQRGAVLRSRREATQYGLVWRAL